MAEKKNKGKPTEAEIEARRAAKKSTGPLVDDGSDTGSQEPAPTPRLLEKYRSSIVPDLQKALGYKNVFQVPRVEKIVISMGLGRFATAGGEGRASFERAERELTVIAGQKPVRCKSKKSVSNFKVREGMETGLKVTLRGTRMYEFLDRLISLAIPRVKDFRGLDPNGFDKDGNYNFGFNEQTVFPEVDGAEVQFQQGMNITMVTTATDTKGGRELLRRFGLPFRDTQKQAN